MLHSTYTKNCAEKIWYCGKISKANKQSNSQIEAIIRMKLLPSTNLNKTFNIYNVNDFLTTSRPTTYNV